MPAGLCRHHHQPHSSRSEWGGLQGLKEGWTWLGNNEVEVLTVLLLLIDMAEV